MSSTSSSPRWPDASPYAVGAVTLGILLFLLVGLLMFGAGRDHS